MTRWAAFLDRDGTLIDDVGLVASPADVKVLPSAAGAIRRLREAGGLVIVVTNQPVVARGLIDEEGLRLIHRRFEELLAAERAPVDALYYCPHHPETHHPEANDPRYRRECECRKPKTGMLLAAARRFGIDLGRSFMVGDTTRDLQTARNAGCRAVLVQTGYAGRDALFAARPDAVCRDVGEAADWIVAHLAEPAS